MNIWLWAIAIIFFIWQNAYFGWNTFPKSDAELMADGITLLMFMLTFTGHSRPIKIAEPTR